MTTINYAAALPVLRKGRERIAKGWTRGWFARDSIGKICDPWKPQAVCWCSEGAVCGEDFMGEGNDAAHCVLQSMLQRESGFRCVPTWNDTPGRTQAEVLALFDRAIAECEEKTR